MRKVRSDYQVKKSVVDYWDALMAKEKVDLYEEKLPSDECVRKFTTKFGITDCEMEVQVCTSQDDVWCQACLFDKDGNEVGYTEVDDNLLGDWEIEYDGLVYVMSLIPFADK